MRITGKLQKNNIIVEKPKDVGRLYNKSRMGSPISGGVLKLNLIEGCFLIDEEKIDILSDGKKVDFETVVKIASREVDNFEIKYLVFRDLRRRGHIIKLSEDELYDFFQFNKKEENPEFFVCVFSERDFFDIEKTQFLLDKLCKGSVLWFAIVDDEGDITYYNVSYADFKGSVKPKKFGKIKGLVLDDRVLIFDKKNKDLFEKEFFGKPFGSALQISFVEGLIKSYVSFFSTASINSSVIPIDKLKFVIASFFSLQLMNSRTSG